MKAEEQVQTKKYLKDSVWISLMAESIKSLLGMNFRTIMLFYSQAKMKNCRIFNFLYYLVVKSLLFFK